MMRLLYTLLLLVTLFSAAGAEAQSTDSLTQAELCKAALRNAGLNDIDNLVDSNVVEQCRQGDMKKDLSIEMMAFALGEPFYHVLETGSNFGLYTHSLNKDDASLNMLKPLHKVIEAFNWGMFYTLLFLFALVFLVQLFRWAKSDKEMGYLKWMNRNFSQNALSISMTMPVIGWMTPIQFIAALFIVAIIYVGKFTITLFFSGMFFADTAINLSNDVTPMISQNIGETIIINRCDLLKREGLINKVIQAEGITDRPTLEANQVYQCLKRPSEHVVSDKPVFIPDSSSYSVTLKNIANFNTCLNENSAYFAEKRISLYDMRCGDIDLVIPNTISNQSILKEKIAEVFLSNQVQNTLMDIAQIVHEYSCRYGITAEENKFGQFTATCAKTKTSSEGYELEWITDNVEQKDTIARFINPLSNESLLLMRQDLERKKNAAMDGIMQQQSQITSILKEVAGNTEGETNVPSNDEDINRLSKKIDKGAWMISAFFLSKTVENLKDQTISETLAGFYTANSSSINAATTAILTANPAWLLTQDFEPLTGKSDFKQKILSGNAGEMLEQKTIGLLIPDFGLYKNQHECWRDQSRCQLSDLNPFISIGEAGAKVFNHAVAGYILTSVLSKTSNLFYSVTGIKTRFMAVTVLNEFYSLYLILGVILALVIPLYPLLKIMSMCIKWGLEVLKELMGLQLNLAFSPFSEPSRKVINEDLRKSFSRLIALGLYFIFVLLGVLTMFLTFTFLFGLNVLIIGGLSLALNLAGDSYFLETMFFNIAFDVIVAVILFLQVKACTDLAEHIPEALAERFSLELSQTEDVAGQIMMKIKSQAMPGVSNFMSKLR